MRGNACNDCGMLVREAHAATCKHNYKRPEKKPERGLTPPKRGRVENARGGK